MGQEITTGSSSQHLSCPGLAEVVLWPALRHIRLQCLVFLYPEVCQGCCFSSSVSGHSHPNYLPEKFSPEVKCIWRWGACADPIALFLQL